MPASDKRRINLVVFDEFSLLQTFQ